MDFFSWIEARPFAVAIAESPWMFPAIEVVHVCALTLVVGSIAILDLRLIGRVGRDRGVMELAAEVLPWTWVSFTVAGLSGLLMFCSAATNYVDNIPFRVKLLLLVAAGVNMMIFHSTIYRTVHEWDRTLPTPPSARVAGMLSLTFWICVVFLGRWIGFV